MNSLCIAIKAAFAAGNLDTTGGITNGLHAEGKVAAGKLAPVATYLFLTAPTNPTLNGKFPFDATCQFMTYATGGGALVLCENLANVFDAAGILANCNMRDSMRLSVPMDMPNDPAVLDPDGNPVSIAAVTFRFSCE